MTYSQQFSYDFPLMSTFLPCNNCNEHYWWWLKKSYLLSSLSLSSYPLLGFVFREAWRSEPLSGGHVTFEVWSTSKGPNSQRAPNAAFSWQLQHCCEVQHSEMPTAGKMICNRDWALGITVLMRNVIVPSSDAFQLKTDLISTWGRTAMTKEYKANGTDRKRRKKEETEI